MSGSLASNVNEAAVDEDDGEVPKKAKKVKKEAEDSAARKKPKSEFNLHSDPYYGWGWG